jgi:two-component system, OmpR family, phosphate regulon sensor histidine kinase PhoR
MPCAITSSSSTISTFAILRPIMENPDLEAERGRRLLEESPEIVLVLDDDDRVIVASRRARETLDGLVLGERVPPDLLQPEPWRPRRVPVEVDGRRESLVWLREPGDLAAYEELRAGFTAAVSHELRTPLARLLALLETASLPSVNVDELIEQGKAEVEAIRELIDDVLFLSELETDRAVVSLTSTRAAPIVREVLDGLSENAIRAGITLGAELDEEADVPLRPRMLRVVIGNLAENAIRYAGDGANFSIRVGREGDEVVITAADDGVGVSDEDLQRLFERFYRSDRARASRGTGLGLAIVKHIVTSAGGRVAAATAPGHGLEIRIAFPA